MVYPEPIRPEQFGSKACRGAPVAQRTEHPPPKRKMQVRFLPGAQLFQDTIISTLSKQALLILSLRKTSSAYFKLMAYRFGRRGELGLRLVKITRRESSGQIAKKSSSKVPA